MRKIFFIGSNKTGTSTFHETLIDAGIKSRHNPRWCAHSIAENKEFFEEWDAFSDGRGNGNLEWLDKTFNSFFVFNTRNVKDWAVSRWNHAQRNKGSAAYRRRKPNGFLFNTKKDVIKWIRERDIFHKQSMEFLKDKKNFLILDLTADSNKVILQKLSQASGKKIKSMHKRNVQKNKARYNKKPKEVMQALKALNIKPEDYNKIILDLK